jgi:hypothetical protein
MKALLLFSITAALLLPAGPCPADSPAPVAPAQIIGQLAWLAGHWQGGSGGQVTEELWLPPAGGLMLGLNREVSADGRAFFEYLRIEQTGEGIFYHASPMGGPATAFKLVSQRTAEVVFENKAHDFPQRITYRLTGPDKLEVVIEGESGGQTDRRSWSWTRLSGVSNVIRGAER